MSFDFAMEPGKSILDRGQRKDGNPLVSIVTAFYNAGSIFEQTFRSVENQTFPWFEWLIVDDGSTDAESVALLERLAEDDPRIRILKQKNLGTAAARNTGIRNSCTDLVVPLDADDLIEPVFLEMLWFSMKKHKEAAWAYTDSVGFGSQQYLWRKSFSAKRMKKENLLVCTAAIRKEWLERVGGYTVTEEPCDEDWDLWLKLLSDGAVPMHLKGYGFWYRRSEDGRRWTVQNDRKLQRRSREMIRRSAESVPNDREVIEYPRVGKMDEFIPPEDDLSVEPVIRKKDRIYTLMLLPWMVTGGADRFNLDICTGLDRDRFEVGIITTEASDNNWHQRFSSQVTDLFHLPDFLDVADYPAFLSYFIRSRRVDVLFLSNSYYGYYLVPWLRRQFPDLVIVDYVHMEEWYWRNGGYARISGVIGNLLEKTYVCNEGTRRVMIDRFRREEDRVETLYVGVDTERFDPDIIPRGHIEKTLGIGKNRPVILFPCRLHPQKRPYLMLEIAERVREKMPRAAFVVLGDGPQAEGLRTSVRQKGLEDTVFFAGEQEDLRPWYRDASLTLICSLKEGLSLTAYESLAMATPVVSADVGGQRELIDDRVGRLVPLVQDEKEDLYSEEFDPVETNGYVNAITELLSDQDVYRKICANCRERVENGFTVKQMVLRLEKELTEMSTDPAFKKQRLNASLLMAVYPGLAEELVTLAGELQEKENSWKKMHNSNVRNELMRIANSRWGSRLIRLAFSLRLNRLFR